MDLLFITIVCYSVSKPSYLLLFRQIRYRVSYQTKFYTDFFMIYYSSWYFFNISSELYFVHCSRMKLLCSYIFVHNFFQPWFLCNNWEPLSWNPPTHPIFFKTHCWWSNSGKSFQYLFATFHANLISLDNLMQQVLKMAAPMTKSQVRSTANCR